MVWFETIIDFIHNGMCRSFGLKPLPILLHNGICIWFNVKPLPILFILGYNVNLLIGGAPVVEDAKIGQRETRRDGRELGPKQPHGNRQGSRKEPRLEEGGERRRGGEQIAGSEWRETDERTEGGERRRGGERIAGSEWRGKGPDTRPPWQVKMARRLANKRAKEAREMGDEDFVGEGRGAASGKKGRERGSDMLGSEQRRGGERDEETYGNEWIGSDEKVGGNATKRPGERRIRTADRANGRARNGRIYAGSLSNEEDVPETATNTRGKAARPSGGRGAKVSSAEHDDGSEVNDPVSSISSSAPMLSCELVSVSVISVY